jgi:hypothetical protein
MGDPRLLLRSEEVTDPRDPAIRELVSDMFETMRAVDGAGLAAPQIGVPLRVVIFGYRDQGQANPRYPGMEVPPETILINPELTPLGEDLESFAETLDEGLLFNFGVRLTSDVREQLQSMLSVLRNARKAVVISHNRAVLGDPDKIVLFRRASDYLPAAAHTIISLSLALGRSDKAFHNLVEKVVSDVSSRFFFSDEKDADHFADLTYKEGYSAQYAALHSVPVSSAAASLSAVLDNLEVNYDNEEAVLDCAESIFEAWIGSDSYLIHALTYELQGITSGYASVFYQQLLGGELADASPLLLPMTSKSS